MAAPQAGIPLTWNEALSGVFGSISLASWIFLLVPQLIENYRLGSADGISITFIILWAIGDVLSLAGALWAGLVPTVIALAIYFCFADVALILQCFYYNTINKRRREQKAREDANGASSPQDAHAAQNEQTPLLNNTKSVRQNATRRLTDVTDDNLGLPGSRRRSSIAHDGLRRTRTTSSAQQESLMGIPEDPSSASVFFRNALSIFLILAAGAGGWAIAYATGVWTPTAVEGPGDVSDGKEHTPLGAELLGYASAVLYLGARIPQIIKNQRERSCDGLSLLFFMLSLLGNATYGAGILFHSLERDYVLTNLPWLIGSLGTMAEDAIIFIQFSVFGERDDLDAVYDDTAVE